MKSSSFGLGVNEADVQLFMNVTCYKFGSSHENFVVGPRRGGGGYSHVWALYVRAAE